VTLLLFRGIRQTEILPGLTKICLNMNPPLDLPLCSNLPLRLIFSFLDPEFIKPRPARPLRPSPRAHWTDARAPPPPPARGGEVGPAEPSSGKWFSSHELVDEGG